MIEEMKKASNKVRIDDHRAVQSSPDVASFQPAPRLAVYAATKAYVTNPSESLHEEAKRDCVHVTALCPGITRTEFQSVSNADAYTGKYPAFVWMEPEAVAKVALTIQRFLSVSSDPMELAGLVSPDVDSFYFSEPLTRKMVNEVWGV